MLGSSHPLLNAPFRRCTHDCQHITGSLNQAGTRRPTVTHPPPNPPPPSPQIMLLSTHCQVVVSHSRFIFSGSWAAAAGARDCVDNTAAVSLDCASSFFFFPSSGGGRGQSRYHPIISLTATCQNRVAGNRCAEMRAMLTQPNLPASFCLI